MDGRRSTLLLTLIASCAVFTPQAEAQSRFGDTMVTVVKDKVIAFPAGNSAVEEGLSPGETVVLSGGRGQTGFAQTSTRLLGFSSELRRWADVQLAVEERVERHQVLPRLILAHSNRQVYGFQEGRAHWMTEPLSTRETVKQMQGRGHVAVAITTDRALAFSSFTGGFFSIAWSMDEKVLSIDESHDAVIIRTSSRTLAFRSQTTEWVEVR